MSSNERLKAFLRMGVEREPVPEDRINDIDSKRALLSESCTKECNPSSKPPSPVLKSHRKWMVPQQE